MLFYSKINEVILFLEQGYNLNSTIEFVLKFLFWCAHDIEMNHVKLWLVSFKRINVLKQAALRVFLLPIFIILMNVIMFFLNKYIYMC